MKLVLQAIKALFRKIEASRTHWEAVEEVEVVAKTTVTITEDGGRASLPDISHILTVGQTYFVTLNGVAYECVAWISTEDSDEVIIGNGAIYGGDGGNDEPFSFYSNSNCEIYLMVATAGTYTISISTVENVVHKLDKKYMPDDIMTEIHEAKTAANRAQASADIAYAKANNVPRYFENNSIAYAAEPYSTVQLSVGERTVFKSYHSVYSTYLKLPNGSRVKIYFGYYRDDGKIVFTDVILTKTERYLIGGQWVSSGLSSPHYYEVQIGPDAYNSYITRYV